MVQRPTSDMGPRRPTGVTSNAIIDSSNDDSNGNQSLSIAVLMSPVQALMDYCNIQANDMMWSLTSGELYQASWTHPEPRKIYSEDHLTRCPSRSPIDEIEEFDYEDTASENGQARGLPRAGRHNRTPQRKRRGSSSLTPASRVKRKPAKSRRAAIRSGHNSDSEDEVDDLEGAEYGTQYIRVADVYRLYYDNALRSISQLVCKGIVKAWIKVCHPKKQTTHPYNGGKTGGERSRAEYGYLGHYTMPDYWPSDENWLVGWGCRHREPDHVKKAERLILLVHLLRIECKGFVDGDFKLKKLIKSTEGIHLEFEKHWKPEYAERLKEIYRVRAEEMRYELGEIDGDTLVPVRMPKVKPRSKVRKSPKSAPKAACPASEQTKEEPEESSPATFTAPVANMGINLPAEGQDTISSAGSESSNFADTPSSTEEGFSDASCPEPVLREASTFQHGLPFFDPSSPTDVRHNLAQKNSTQQSANLGQGHTTFIGPNPFGSAATHGEAQRSLPFRDRYHFGSSSMQGYPSQKFPRRQCNHESTASRRFTNPRRPNGTLTLSPPARPVAPKVENIRHQPFAASSSGLVGAFSAGVDYSRWQTDDLWNAQTERPMYTAVADPSVSLLPSTIGSFSTGYSDASFSNGLNLDTWNGGNQALMQPCHQGLDEERQRRFNFQAIGIPGYQPLDMNTLSSGNPDMPNQFLFTANQPTDNFTGYRAQI